MTPCPDCGHEGRGRHRAGCKRHRNINRSGPNLAMAREWFHLFGHDTNVISPTGRALFRYLLSEVERKHK